MLEQITEKIESTYGNQVNTTTYKYNEANKIITERTRMEYNDIFMTLRETLKVFDDNDNILMDGKNRDLPLTLFLVPDRLFFFQHNK